ncbi:g-type lectin s-receptor-like serine/threonine-protein kinase at4g27290 [Phtheirospermum japonicum]|uniref:Receptor-like serine/threonine-protein kinase n=1 Tax=Phtheirospermum japonicum TaxID=374723 RepID=A0A830BW91_9LAMI|nr:g-type lectin s-receptor-like serine/threonine-protein kinase at4g27290 [Phtheirospermum japonicum]
MNGLFKSICVLLVILSSQNLSSANDDTLNTSQIIIYNQTLVSSTGKFELGFFSPESSSNWYLGVWYKNINVRTVVWVANRETPLRNSTSGVLTLVEPGVLIIFSDTNTTVWSSNTSIVSRNPTAQLLDSGNLVLRDTAKSTNDNYLWRSFEYPTDTFLPGMDFGLNLVTGKQIYLTSWKSNEDPALGDFTIKMDIAGYPQIVIKRGDALQYRIGPWNGLRFSGMPNIKLNRTMTATLVMNSSVVYYSGFAISSLVYSRFMLSPSGTGQQFTWVDRAHDWVVYYKFPADICDNYRSCGAHGSCNNENFPVCGCLERFVPRDEESWATSDWSGGCVRRTPLSCRDDVFLKYSGLKMPDARRTWYNESLSLEECEAVCLRNCSCTAYSNLDISNGSGCLLWFGDLVDIRQLSGEPQEIYIRMAASELDSSGRKRTTLIAVLTSLAGVVLLGLSLSLFIWKSRKNDRKVTKEEGPEESNDEDLEMPIYDLLTVSKATNSFSDDNKLGEGGFGPVYKGMLEDGKEIAVKRLSETSMQGLDEFKNEVLCIAKLQHRNLVKLLGCCLEGDEKMLIYEYMHNKSLDFFLFANRMSLDWPRRLHIINGLARGLMYLHQDSRLRIIHRDLKASNILLDSEMNPRISDFGIAKRVRGNETEHKTGRVVGTYGYMSPEYAFRGQYSVKSDVFSFGVLVLEIVSGERNCEFSIGDHGLNLLGHAWTLYKEGRPMELVDTCLYNLGNLDEVARLIHLGLLCVQHRAKDRPDMTKVIAMLSNDSVLPQPNHPGLFTESDTLASESNAKPCPGSCTNNITITMIDGR